MIPSSLQVTQLHLHVLTQALVERAERLVHEQYRRLEDDRARQRHPLLLAARELARIAVGETVQPHQPQRAPHALDDVGLRGAPHLQRVGDVLEHGEMREERVLLEDDADVAAVGRPVGDRGAGDQDVALRRLLEAGDHPQRGRLARAAGAEQREEAAALHRERDVVNDAATAERLGEPAHLERRAVDPQPGAHMHLSWRRPGLAMRCGTEQSNRMESPAPRRCTASWSVTKASSPVLAPGAYTLTMNSIWPARRPCRRPP